MSSESGANGDADWWSFEAKDAWLASTFRENRTDADTRLLAGSRPGLCRTSGWDNI